MNMLMVEDGKDGIHALGGCGLAPNQGLSRRDILADAAIRRMQREKNEGSQQLFANGVHIWHFVEIYTTCHITAW
jgi:hypothetical protein